MEQEFHENQQICPDNKGGHHQPTMTIRSNADDGIDERPPYSMSIRPIMHYAYFIAFLLIVRKESVACEINRHVEQEPRHHFGVKLLRKTLKMDCLLKSEKGEYFLYS